MSSSAEPQASEAAASRLPVSPLMARLSAMLAGLVYLIGYIVAMVCCVAVADGPDPMLAMFIGAAVALLLWLAAIAIHECGHLIAAECSTMQTMRMRILDFEFRRRRTGWSVRVHRSKHEPAGFVQAFPTDFDTVRRDYLRMIAGGPAANMLVCSIAIVGIAVASSDTVRYLWSALAAIHLSFAIANLLPYASKNAVASDGMLLLQWWRNEAMDDAGEAYLRLIALALRGVRASELPRDLIERIAAAPQPAAMNSDWFELGAACDRADWATARNIGDGLLAKLEALPQKTQETTSDWAMLIRIEAAFAAAMLERDSAAIDALRIPPHLIWYVPGVRDRFDALRAALAGDQARCRDALMRMIAHAEDSVDRSAVPHHMQLCAQIEAVLSERIVA
jgi:hypothetical protein